MLNYGLRAALRASRCASLPTAVSSTAARARRLASTRAETNAAPPPPSSSSSSSLGTKLAIAGGVLLGAAGAGAMLANSVLVGPVLKLARFTGVDVDFDSVTGTLFYPKLQLEFTNLRVKRTMQGKDRDYAASFDVRLERAQVVGVKMVDKVVHIDSFYGEGVSGSVETAPWSPPLPPMFFRALKLQRSVLSVRSWEQTSSVTVSIRQFEAGPEGFRLPEVPISILGSRINCSLDSGELITEPRRGIAIKNMPLARLAPLVPPGNLLEWLAGGLVDIEAVTTWLDRYGAAFEDARQPHPDFVDMKVQVMFRDFTVNSNKGANVGEKLGVLAAVSLAAYLESQKRKFQVALQVRVPWESLNKLYHDTKGASSDAKMKGFAELICTEIAKEIVKKAIGGAAAAAFGSS